VISKYAPPSEKLEAVAGFGECPTAHKEQNYDQDVENIEHRTCLVYFQFEVTGKSIKKA
jgi:hypothetical protein